MSALGDRVLATLCRIAPEIDRASIDHGRALVDQLDLDSMDYQTFLAMLSDEYSIEIRAVDVPTLRTIDDLARYIERQKTRAP